MTLTLGQIVEAVRSGDGGGPVMAYPADIEEGEALKRFALFAGRDYDHTGGGWRDFHGSFVNVHEARAHNVLLRLDWWHVIDLKTGQEVASGD